MDPLLVMNLECLGAAQHRGSILAAHPAGSILSILRKIYSDVAEIYDGAN